MVKKVNFEGKSKGFGNFGVPVLENGEKWSKMGKKWEKMEKNGKKMKKNGEKWGKMVKK